MKSDHGFNEFIESACAALEVDATELRARERGNHALSEARQLIAFMLRTRHRLGYPHIGRLLGNRHHTTVMAGVAKMTRELEDRTPWVVRGVELLGGLGTRPLEIESPLDSLQHNGCKG